MKIDIDFSVWNELPSFKYLTVMRIIFGQLMRDSSKITLSIAKSFLLLAFKIHYYYMAI
jgi:hypothetical protein